MRAVGLGDQRLDALSAGGVEELAAELGIAGGRERIVGADGDAIGRVEHAGLFRRLDDRGRNAALIWGQPGGRGEAQKLGAAAVGCAGDAHADAPIGIGVAEAEVEVADRADGGAELVPVACGEQPRDRRAAVRGPQHQRVERERAALGGRGCARADLAGDDRTVDRAADAERDWAAAGDLDLLVDLLDGGPAVFGAAGAAVFGELFGDGDVGGLHRGCGPPGDAVVVAPDDAGHAWDARAGGVELGAVQVDEVRVRRRDRAEVRVAGEDRRAARGAVAGDGPVVARAAGDAQGAAERRGRFERVAGGAEAAAGRGDGARIRGQGRVDLVQCAEAELGGDAGAGDLLLPGGAEQEREQLGPGDRVLRSPGADLRAEQPRLERARRALDGRVDAGEVGRDLTSLVLAAALPSLFSDAGEAERAGEPVGGQPAFADEGGDASGGGEAAPVHLPEAVARLREAHSEQRVAGRAGEDVRDGITVAQDLDPGVDAVEGDAPAGERPAAGQQHLVRERPGCAGGAAQRAQHSRHAARFIPRGYGVGGPRTPP